MSDLDDSFAKLLGRQPSDKERIALYRVRDALGLRNNDALWLVLMALEHYLNLYDIIPSRIEATATRTLDKVITTIETTSDETIRAAEATIKASAETTMSSLADAVAKTANEVAHNTSRKQMWRWALGCLVTATVILGGIFWYGKHTGYAQGYGECYAKVQDEKAMASWANTPEGQSRIA